MDALVRRSPRDRVSTRRGSTQLGVRAAVGISLLASAIACGVVLPPIQWRGAALEYGASPESVVCAGTHEYLDRYVEQLAGELALELPERVRYYWIDAADVDRRCGEGHTGCASGFESVGNEPINHHELVHNVLHALDDHDAHWFFEEGLAELMDPTYFLRNRTHQVNDPRDWIAKQQHDHLLGYDTAGEFAAFLVHRRGFALFERLLVEGDPCDGVEEVREVFREVYGEEFDAVASSFVNERVCVADGYPVVPYFCTAPAIPWVGDQWRLSKSMSCEDDEVLGGSGDRWAVVTIEVPEPGVYSVTSDGAVTTIGSCSGCPWGAPTAVAKGYTVETELSAGKYFVHVHGRHELTVDVVPVSS